MGTPRSPWRRPAPGIVAAALLVVAGCAPPVYLAPKAGTVPFATSTAPAPGQAGARPFRNAPAAGAPTLAVRPLVDARPDAERTRGSSWVPAGNGYTGDAETRDDRWRRPVVRLATDALARALAATGRFRSVRRIAGAATPRADYVLTGRLRRLRGWERYHVVRGNPPRIIEGLGDAFVDRIEIVARRTGRLAFVGEAGALLDGTPAALDPYRLARRAYAKAVKALARRVARADLAHADLKRTVRLAAAARGDLDALLGHLPAGWSGRRLTPGLPPGWRGRPTCGRVRLTDRTRTFFNPSLGAYHPGVTLWRCPATFRGATHLSDPKAPRWPAELLGVGPGGRPWLVRALGETSWPSARGDLRRFLGLAPPPPGLPVLRLPVQPRGGAPRR